NAPADLSAPAPVDWFSQNAPQQRELIDRFSGNPEQLYKPSEHPYMEGAAQAVLGMVPRSLSDVQRMVTLPMPSHDVEKNLQESEQLGAAWRGEYGPQEQAASITRTALQAL